MQGSHAVGPALVDHRSTCNECLACLHMPMGCTHTNSKSFSRAYVPSLSLSLSFLLAYLLRRVEPLLR